MLGLKGRGCLYPVFLLHYTSHHSLVLHIHKRVVFGIIIFLVETRTRTPIFEFLHHMNVAEIMFLLHKITNIISSPINPTLYFVVAFLISSQKLWCLWDLKIGFKVDGWTTLAPQYNKKNKLGPIRYFKGYHTQTPLPFFFKLSIKNGRPNFSLYNTDTPWVDRL